MTQVHQLNIQAIGLLSFCFICRISRSLCNLMFWFLEWYFVSSTIIPVVKFYFNQMDYNILNHYVDSCHFLETTFIQDIDFQNLAGPHSAVYIVQVICSTTYGSQYKFDVGVFCLPSMN